MCAQLLVTKITWKRIYFIYMSLEFYMGCPKIIYVSRLLKLVLEIIIYPCTFVVFFSQNLQIINEAGLHVKSPHLCPIIGIYPKILYFSKLKIHNLDPQPILKSIDVMSAKELKWTRKELKAISL